MGDEWAAVAGGEPRPLTALGWQGLQRVLVAGEVVRALPPTASLLSLAVDLAAVSEADLTPGTTPDELHRMLRPGATLAVTRGASGGLAMEAASAGQPPTLRRYPAIPSDSSIDATGAGDVFLAALLAARLQPSLGDPFTVAAAAA